MRSIHEIMEHVKRCPQGCSPKEIVELCYKIREDIPLTSEEQELRNIYFKPKKKPREMNPEVSRKYLNAANNPPMQQIRGIITRINTYRTMDTAIYS